jgi:hypothetical protein
VIACAPDEIRSISALPLRQIGVVGGDMLGGIPVSTLAGSWRDS